MTIPNGIKNGLIRTIRKTLNDTEDELKDLIHAVFKFVEDVKQEYSINN